MNSRERILTALRNETHDKVQILELSIDPKVIQGIMPGHHGWIIMRIRI